MSPLTGAGQVPWLMFTPHQLAKEWVSQSKIAVLLSVGRGKDVENAKQQMSTTYFCANWKKYTQILNNLRNVIKTEQTNFFGHKIKMEGNNFTNFLQRQIRNSSPNNLY